MSMAGCQKVMLLKWDNVEIYHQSQTFKALSHYHIHSRRLLREIVYRMLQAVVTASFTRL